MKKKEFQIVCKVCGDKKERSEFHRSDDKKTICKDCLKNRDMYGPEVFESEGYS